MNKKRVACVMIRHPDYSSLILHGRRSDNKKWAMPGGHMNEDEKPMDAAHRELKEETGLKTALISRTQKDYGNIEVHLFEAKCPADLALTVGQDPDGEFETFKFLDPKIHDNLYVPKDRNLLLEYLK